MVSVVLPARDLSQSLNLLFESKQGHWSWGKKRPLDIDSTVLLYHYEETRTATLCLGESGKASQEGQSKQGFDGYRGVLYQTRW